MMVLLRPRNSAALHLRLRGGLGNQLFQIFGAAYYAKRFRLPLIVNDKDISFHADHSRRSWSRDYNWRNLLPDQEVEWVKFESTFGKRILDRIPFLSRSLPLVNEEFLSSLQFLDSSIEVKDWFQNKNFLSDDSLVLAREFFLPKVVRGSTTELVNKLARIKRGTVIHIRLGDFLLPKNQLMIPWNYYRAAIKSVIIEGSRTLILFSDDLPLATGFVQHAIREFEDIEIFCPENTFSLVPDELLWVLSHAQVFISSNSTLSWWAAMLNKEGTVYSPFMDDLHLDHWRDLNVSSP